MEREIDSILDRLKVLRIDQKVSHRVEFKSVSLIDKLWPSSLLSSMSVFSSVWRTHSIHFLLQSRSLSYMWCTKLHTIVIYALTDTSSHNFRIDPQYLNGYRLACATCAESSNLSILTCIPHSIACFACPSISSDGTMLSCDEYIYRRCVFLPNHGRRCSLFIRLFMLSRIEGWCELNRRWRARYM